MSSTFTDRHQADATQVLGVFALELRSGQMASLRPALAQADAGELAALLARDLAKVAPQAATLDLVLAAAHFDPAEALRPGWPLHRRLHELHQRAPRTGATPRVIAFGADARNEVPPPFQDDPELRGGALRVLPFLLTGEAAAIAEVGETFETTLLDRGMAAADTALAVQAGFASPIEHARYLTIHDLAAMTAMQYGNLGLDPLWPIIETALLAPQRIARLDAPPEPLVDYANGEAHIRLFTPAAWRARGDAAGLDADTAARRLAMFEARQRQFAAVLRAHGIEVVFDFERDG